MLERSLLGAVAALLCFVTQAWAWDDARYPDLKGQWRAIGGPGRFDISKPAGRGQQAPLTPEYQAIFEANLIDQASGGQGTTPTYKCISPGMPRVTNGYGEIEFVITPQTTYILVDHILDDRRIFTDGRSWPAYLEPTLLGYSIGHWVDTKGDGHFDELDVETRGFRGPRAFDASGLPLHQDNETVVKERIYRYHPFIDLLFGVAHSNVYGNAYQTICLHSTGNCAFSGSPSSDAFAMSAGGGIDLPVNDFVDFRVGQIDYLATDFSNQFTHGWQRNFRFNAGLNIKMGTLIPRPQH